MRSGSEGAPVSNLAQHDGELWHAFEAASADDPTERCMELTNRSAAYLKCRCFGTRATISG
jgi:hypothetical protein